MSAGDFTYSVVRAGPKGGWALMHSREGVTALYEDTKDLEVAVFGEPFLALANLVAAELTRIANSGGEDERRAADCDCPCHAIVHDAAPADETGGAT